MQGRQRRSVKKFLREFVPNIGSDLTAFEGYSLRIDWYDHSNGAGISDGISIYRTSGLGGRRIGR